MHSSCEHEDSVRAGRTVADSVFNRVSQTQYKDRSKFFEHELNRLVWVEERSLLEEDILEYVVFVEYVLTTGLSAKLNHHSLGRVHATNYPSLTMPRRRRIIHFFSRHNVRRIS